MSRPPLAAASALVLWAAACSPVVGRDGGTDSGADAGDAAVDLSTSYACGSLTCGPQEYCIHTCCAPACAGSAAGQCPFGTHLDGTCTDGCRADSCTPPPWRCSATDPCIGVARTGRDAYCVCG